MGKPPIRVIKGRQYHWFTEESKRAFFRKRVHGDFAIRSDGLPIKRGSTCFNYCRRNGFGGGELWFHSGTTEGDPIVLLADRQTTGGYPKIAQIATVDLPVIAQAKPGDKLQFKNISLQDSQSLFLKREEQIKQLKVGISLLHG